MFGELESLLSFDLPLVARPWLVVEMFAESLLQSKSSRADFGLYLCSVHLPLSSDTWLSGSAAGCKTASGGFHSRYIFPSSIEPLGGTVREWRCM